MFKILVYFVGMYIAPVNVCIAGGTYSPQLAGVFLPIHHMGHRIVRQMAITCGALAPFWWTLISEITFIKNGGIESQVIRGSYSL